MMAIFKPKNIDTPKQLEKAFSEWGDSIYGFTLLRVQNKETAEDIVQDVFFKAYRSRDTFNSEKSSLKTWLFTIAKNAISDHFRNLKPQTAPIEELKDEISDTKTNIQEDTRNQEQTNIVFNNLKLLNERDQELIILRFKEDLSIIEISKILNIEYSATKVAIHRALKRLSDLCQE